MDRSHSNERFTYDDCKTRSDAGLSDARPTETKEVKVTPLFSKDLMDLPGKEGLMITMEYPPGASDPIHHRLLRNKGTSF